MLRKISDEEIHDLSLKVATVVVFALALISCAVFGAIAMKVISLIVGW